MGLRWGGSLSKVSSTRLKSPSKMLGLGSDFVWISVLIAFQKVLFAEWSFGAYTMGMEICSFPCQMADARRALPEMISCDWIILVSCLFYTRAKPFAFGWVGSIDKIMCSLFWERSLREVSLSLLRWVSCRARVPILSSHTIWFMWYHLSVPWCQWPFMFKVATLMLAHVFLFCGWGCGNLPSGWLGGWGRGVPLVVPLTCPKFCWDGPSGSSFPPGFWECTMLSVSPVLLQGGLIWDT